MHFGPIPISAFIDQDGILIVGQPQTEVDDDLLVRTGNKEFLEQAFAWVEDASDRVIPELLSIELLERFDGSQLVGFPLKELTNGKEEVQVFAVVPSEPGERFEVGNKSVLESLQNCQHASELRTQCPELAASMQLQEEELRISLQGSEALLIVLVDSEQVFFVAKAPTLPDVGSLSLHRLQVAQIPSSNVRRKIAPNNLSLVGKLGVYLDRWSEFLFASSEDPDEPVGMLSALIGTVVLALIMLSVVIPLGLSAALYLREYTQGGILVSLIRASITNLAGVPSIVFGVFGVAFFCYTLGAYLDGGPSNANLQPWASGAWLGVTMIAATVGAISFLAFLYLNVAVSKNVNLARFAMVLWLLCSLAVLMLLLRSPFFFGFFAEDLPNPTFGKGGIFWSALTLSLLALPIMIVHSEEALAQVPNALKEGALGMWKYQVASDSQCCLAIREPGDTYRNNS